MIPLVIEGATHRLTGPEDMPEVRPLFARHDGQAFYTLWEPTPAELAMLAAGGRVLLSILGDGHPPVGLAVIARTPGDAE